MIKNVILRRAISWFFQGLLLLAPIFATIYVVFHTFNFIDTTVNDLIEEVAGKRIPVLGVLIMFAFVTFIGAIGSSIIMRPVILLVEEVLERLPFVKTIYTSLKDFISAFATNRKKFNKPVLVEMGEGNGMYKLGFITQDDLSEMNLKEMVAVYLPHSYNFSGNLYVVKKHLIQPVDDVTGTDIMKFIVSGGITELEEEEEERKKLFS